MTIDKVLVKIVYIIFVCRNFGSYTFKIIVIKFINVYINYVQGEYFEKKIV